MTKKKEPTSIKKYPEPAMKPKSDKNIFTSHKHPNSNSNAIGNNQNLFQQTRDTFQKIRAPYSNIAKKKPKKLLSLKIACYNHYA